MSQMNDNGEEWNALPESILKFGREEWGGSDVIYSWKGKTRKHANGMPLRGVKQRGKEK